MENIVENIDRLCGCGFSDDRITDGVFLCSPTSPQTVTYRAQLHSTRNTNVSQLLKNLQEWVSPGTTVTVQVVPLDVMGVCADSFLEECSNNPVATTSTGGVTTGVTRPTDSGTSASGGGSSVTISISVSVSAVVVCVTIIVIVVLVIRGKRRSSVDLSKTR